MAGDIVARSVVKCTELNSHVFSSTHCGYPAPGYGPGTNTYEFIPFFRIGGFAFTKPMLLTLVAMVVVVWFFWAAFAKPKLVPRGMQNLGELALLAVRDQVVRPNLGKRGDSFLPFLTS